MVEDRAGHRTLYAPTPQLAELLAATYRFDDVQVATCRAQRSGPHWWVQAGPLNLSFTIGRRNLLGWLLWAVPTALARTPWWVGLMDLSPAGCCRGSASVAAPTTDVASGTAPKICTPSSLPKPRSTVLISAPSERSNHRSVSASAQCRAHHL